MPSTRKRKQEESTSTKESLAAPEPASKKRGGKGGRKKSQESEPNADTLSQSSSTEQGTTRNPILETGRIYFFYRTRVELEEAESIEDIQRMYVLLSPHPEIKEELVKEEAHAHKYAVEAGGHKAQPNRLIIIPKKKLPDINRHERFWGFVDSVHESASEIMEDLGEKEYETKTRGLRHVRGAVPVGEGVYALLLHKPNSPYEHAHLAYVLQLPQQPGEVQEAMNIEKEGSYIVSIKNPGVSGPAMMRGAPKPEYPHDILSKAFKGKRVEERRFIPVQPELLNYKGTQVLFVGAKKDIKQELGETGAFLRELAEVDSRVMQDAKAVCEDLDIDQCDFPTEPLISGKFE